MTNIDRILFAVAILSMTIATFTATFSTWTTYRTTQLFACPPDQVVMKGDFGK